MDQARLLAVACILWLARWLIVPVPVLAPFPVLVLVLVLVKSLLIQLHRFFVNGNGNRCAVNGNALAPNGALTNNAQTVARLHAKGEAFVGLRMVGRCKAPDTWRWTKATSRVIFGRGAPAEPP